MRDTTDDGRYSIRIEGTGAFEPADGLGIGQRWVARFMGEWLGSATTKAGARQIADQHYTAHTFGPDDMLADHTLALAADRIRMRADCGHMTMPNLTLGRDWPNHADSPGLGASGGSGYSADADGFTRCYACSDQAERETMRTAQRVTAYLAADSRHVTTWAGGVLGRVTESHVSKAARKTYVTVIDADGAQWYGVGPAESGTYVNLRRSRVKSA